MSSCRAAISASIWQALPIGYCSDGLAAFQLCVHEVFQDFHRASKLSVAVQQAYELYFACFMVLQHVTALLQGGAGAVHTPHKMSCAAWHSLKDVRCQSLQFGTQLFLVAAQDGLRARLQCNSFLQQHAYATSAGLSWTNSNGKRPGAVVQEGSQSSHALRGGHCLASWASYYWLFSLHGTVESLRNSEKGLTSPPLVQG